jgi:endonuclease/exonuclease/phosphatase family metal-dependent hydrolase
VDNSRFSRAVLVLLATALLLVWYPASASADGRPSSTDGRPISADEWRSSGEAMRLKVVSYNVWGVPHITPNRAERIAAIAEQLAKLDADFVALQEVWLREDADVLGAALERVGLPHQRFFGPGIVGRNGSGLWIASRYPYDDVEFVPFVVGHKMFIPWHVDWMAQKGIALARVKTPLGIVQVANTHLQAAYSVAEYTNVKVAQALQIGALLRPQNAPLLPESAGAAASPLILMGDLNARAHSLPFQVMTERAALAPSLHVNVDGVLSRSSGDVTITAVETETLFAEPQQINPDLVGVLSDHACLVVNFALRPCEGCAAPVPYKWREVAAHVVQRLRDERVDAERAAWVARVLCVLLPLAGLFLVWRVVRRRTRRRALSAIAAVTLLTLGYWLGYLGWDFGPYEMEMLSAQAAELEGG